MTEISPIDRLAYERLAASQVYHAILPKLTVEELIALGEDRAVMAVEMREQEINRADDDHFNYGWRFDSWDMACWEIMYLRLANPGVPVTMGVGGSNGSGKSFFAGDLMVTAMEQCEQRLPEHQRVFWTFSYDDDKSAEVVESVIRYWQPNDYKTETGRLKKMAAQKMGYDQAGGFTNNELTIPSGAICRFRTWAQFLGKLEGPRPVTVWGDEAVPTGVIEAVEDRLLTSSEYSLRYMHLWEELKAAKEKDPLLRFPREMIQKLLVGVQIITYTFRDGYTDTVRLFMDKCKVLRQIEADPELLPRRNEQKKVVGGELLPCLVQCQKPHRRMLWLYAWQNPIGGNWEGMKKTEKDSPRSKKLWKCYGIAEGMADSPFPNFHIQVHARPVPSVQWLPPADKGTWWMSCDPNASGGRAWFMLWAFVLGEHWHYYGPGDMIIAHEYPQMSDTVIVPSHKIYTGEDCEWAKPGGKNGIGLDGLAQKKWPCGFEFRSAEIRRIEEKLAKWQGLTKPMGGEEDSWLDVLDRRIIDSRSSNTKVEGQDGGKTILEFMEDNRIYFTQAGRDNGGVAKSTDRVIPGEQTIDSWLMWDRTNTVIQPDTKWMEIDPQKGRGPKLRVAEHCTNLIGSLQNYPGFSAPGAASSPWKDPIDTLRILLNADPYHESAQDFEAERGGNY